MKVGDLKAELEKRGLAAAGKKADLVERLSTALAEQAAKPGGGGARRRRVDRSVPSKAEYAVLGDWDVKLLQSDISGGHNSNRFYIIQVTSAATPQCGTPRHTLPSV